MKKVVLALFLSGVSVFGCYDSTSQFARVTLLIGDTSSYSIDRIYIAAFAGVPSPSTVILNVNFEPTSFVTLIIPNAGIIHFTIWGYNSRAGATYYGTSFPLILNGQDVAAVGIQMMPFTSAFNLQYNATTHTDSWNYIYGATQYELTVTRSASPTEFYFTDNTSYTLPGSRAGAPHYVKCKSSIFGIESVNSAGITP